MFNPKSDYALNKLEKDAIVCTSTTGVHIRLTRSGFISEEEFRRWKELSDADYADREKTSRDFYDNCIQMDGRIDTVISAPSAEETLISVQQANETRRQHLAVIAAAITSIKACLTAKQYRRVWMFFVLEMDVKKIAAQEHVTTQAVYTCLAKAKARIVNKL